MNDGSFACSLFRLTCISLCWLCFAQVDNQVFGSYRPVLLYLTPPSRPEEMMDPSPVIQLSAHRIPKSKWNAEIFKVNEQMHYIYYVYTYYLQ